ncbi:helix-turn-helix transcriptional regulator [Devosia sp.]|uniref:AraC family transcriptional regulator n=1 Tax=Devosia sp. TaxID=1871048 RepID=UPI001AC42C33|nr:helix-turn-helix transcriptional regulator [Devosia sp.]MBN9336039.1 helix-turn-helix transcriptional regulator [Devosia sp.]
MIDTPGAPEIIAMAITKDLVLPGAQHRHTSGQLYCLRQGIMMVKSAQGLLANPPGLVGWIPSMIEHSIITSGPVEGWTAFVGPHALADLPEEPAVLNCSGLVEPLVERLAESHQTEWATARYERMGLVLLDELRLAERTQPSLPLPEDPRLQVIARALMDDPADPRSGPELARWAGMSARSLSRHWTQSVGMSLAKYRQVARVFKSLDELSKGASVQHAAWAVGFESTSAYIAAFRAIFGQTPRKYLGKQA